MSEKYSSNEELQKDIDQLKDPKPYQEKFEVKEVQELNQALDILARLQREAGFDASHIGYHKLRRARQYLDQLLEKELKSEK